MIRLLIDGKDAVLKDNLSFKLTSCNPYFASTSTYTYDLELPMTAMENRAIFGDIMRADTPKGSLSLDAELYDGGCRLLSGKAKIVSVTESSVKVQLLGHASAYNYDNEMSELYVDELELGDWCSMLLGGESQHGSAWWIAVAQRVYALDLLMGYDSWRAGMYDGTYCVFFPIINTTNGVTCNEFVFREKTAGSREFRIEYPYNPPGESAEHTGLPQVKVSPQPRLWFMCRLIAQATGYSLADSDNYLHENELLCRVFIANANIHVRANKCLPHWTVKEWWSRVEAAFGVVVVIDDATKAIRLVRRADKYAMLTRDRVVIHDVKNEYSVEVDADNDKEVSSGNTGYADFGAWAWTLLPEDLRSTAVFEQTQYADLRGLAAGVTDGSLEWDRSKIYICRDGRRYAWDEGIPGIREVDQLGPRIVKESSKIDVELKFVPCVQRDSTAKLCLKTYDENNRLYDDVLDNIPVRMLSRPDLDNFSWYEPESSLKPQPLDVGKQLTLLESGESTDKESSKEDVVYIALVPDYNNGAWENMHYDRHVLHGTDIVPVVADLVYPRGWVHPLSWWNSATGDFGGSKESCGLNLNPISPWQTLGGVVQEGGVTVNGAAKYCISFVSESVPDPTALFVINNKPYICEKLEINISPYGADKMITGYFYSMDS